MLDRPRGGTGEMLSLVEAFPDHLAASGSLPGLETIPALPSTVRRIVFCGMGGSAIAGDLLQPMLQHQPVSLTVWRDYGLPHWTGADDLVIVASYSGNTEESLSALHAARALGCMVLGISSGGELRKLANETNGDGFPLVVLPGGFPPRAALGHGLGALLQLLAALGLVPDPTAEIAEACGHLRRTALGCLAPWAVSEPASEPIAENPNIPVHELAAVLKDRIPVLYTAGLDAHAIGSRWKAQLNENAKWPTCVAAFPELNHNDLVGWSLPDSLRERFALVILEAGTLDPRSRIRVDATRKLLEDEFPVVCRIVGEGDSRLTRILSLVQYGDFLSCHLAQLYGVDAMPVDRIESLKMILSAGMNP